MTTPRTPTAPTTSDQLVPVPDLSNYRQIHAALRTSNDRIVVAIDSLSRHPERAVALRRWFAGYHRELVGHHRVEDELFFPALAARVPAYTEYASTLDDDHHRLDGLLDALAGSLDTLADDPADPTAAQASALAFAVELRDLLAEHLDFEDRDVLPMFERHFTADEYGRLDEQSLKDVTVRQALFAVPWYMATASPEMAAKTYAEAPLPLKVVHRLTRRRYARLVREAFGA